MKCIIFECGNSNYQSLYNQINSNNVQFYRFPKDIAIRQQWLDFCGISSDLKDHHRLCSAHFTEEDYITHDSKKFKLKTAVPTINGPLNRNNNSTLNQSKGSDALFFNDICQNDIEVSQISHDRHMKYLIPEEKKTPNAITSTKNLIKSPLGSVSSTSTLAILSSTPVDLNRFSTNMQEENIRLKLQLRESKKVRGRLFQKAKFYRDKNRKLRIEVKRLTKTFAVKHRRIFNENQIKVLKNDVKKNQKWSRETIIESLQIRFACGSGYEFLRKNKKYPLPSQKELLNRIQNVNFDAGILEEMFILLEHKVKVFDKDQKDSVLVLEQISIDEMKEYCLKNIKFYGHVNLDDDSKLATHALVFLLCGIKTRWKQVVAYFVTGNTLPKVNLKRTVIEIITKAEGIGLMVHAVTSDCSPENKVMWNDFGVKHLADFVMEDHYVTHPVAPKRILVFLPNAVHVFKNAVESFVGNKIIYLSDFTVKKYNLPSSEVRVQHLVDLINFEEEKGLKINSKLNLEDIDDEGVLGFGKMVVNTSKKVVNHNVASALVFMSMAENRPELLTTAFFIDQLSKWFETMSCRHHQLNLGHQDAYDKTINRLKSFIEIIHGCRVGFNNAWKPWLGAIILGTRGILKLQQYFLVDRKYSFLFLGRFLQDCIENLFPLVRNKMKTPSAMQFKNCLRLISLSQYMRELRNTSYDYDDTEYLLGFLDLIESNAINPWRPQ